MKEETRFGWHFAKNDMRLGYDDGREIRDGETLTHDGPLILCKKGLHFSEDILDALHWSRGHMICRIEGPADALDDGDKQCGSWRKCLWHVDGKQLLPEFARWCALQVIHLWDAPSIVREYLETGDESKWYDAWYVTRHAALERRSVRYRYAWYATWYAILAIAQDTTLHAIRAAIRARIAIQYATTWDATRDAQREKLLELIENARRQKYGTM